jgi:uncharacterized protein YhbP (UPF0306 family)
MARLRIVGVVGPDGTSLREVRRIAPERVRASAMRILAQNALCALSTVSPGGRPHVNTAYFCSSDELELFFLSHPASQHCRNLAANGSAAIAVYDSRQKWGGPDRGLQLFGTCARARGSRAARLYAVRFPAYARWLADRRVREPESAYRFFRFVCTGLKLLDERGLGEARFFVANVARR